MQGSVTLANGRQAKVEIYSKSPGKRATVIHLENGDSRTAYSANMGWTAVPARGVRDMTAADVDGAQLEDAIFSPSQVQQLFTEFKVDKTEQVGDRAAYLVQGIRPNMPPVLLYFDTNSGLLLRMVRYTETAFGRLPTQVEYADYRDVDGIKVAFQRILSTPLDRQSILVEQVKQNIPVAESLFEKPSLPAAASGQGQSAR